MPHWKWWQILGWREIPEPSLWQWHSPECIRFYCLRKNGTEGR